MKFQPWEKEPIPDRPVCPFCKGAGSIVGIQTAIQMLRARAKRAEAEAQAFGFDTDLANAAWLRHVTSKMAANFLQLKVDELRESKKAYDFPAEKQNSEWRDTDADEA